MLNVYGVDSLYIVRAPNPPDDQWGEPLPVTLEAVSGYLEWKTKLVRNFAGEEVISSANFLLNYDGTINHLDKLRIGTKDYPIIGLEPAKDFSNVGITIFIA